MAVRSALAVLASLSFLQAVLLPSVDEFYQPPSGYAQAKPGTVLRMRPILPINLSQTPLIAGGVQLVYPTRSVNGTAIVGVTTLITPFNAIPGRFVSYQIAEDSANVDCSPSYNLQLGSSETNPTAVFEYPMLQAYLNAGYAVSVPDYQGPDSACTAGRLEGYGVLDSMRAVSNFMGGNPAIVGVGYSGGAIAAGWAAALHPTYAPELNVKGWTLGGTAANLTTAVVNVGYTPYSGLLLASFSGLNKPSSYQALLKPLFDRILTPFAQQQFAIANSLCAIGGLLSFSNQSMLSYDIQTLGPDILYQPEFVTVMADNALGTHPSEVPTAPVLMYHAVHDQIVPYNYTVELQQSWCHSGANVHFKSYTFGDHLSTEAVGLASSLKFTTAAFSGSVARGCTFDSISIDNLDKLGAT